MYLKLQGQLEFVMKETHEPNEKMQLMMEQLALNKQARFGRCLEMMTNAGQICFKEVKSIRSVKSARRKEEHISGLPVNRTDHYLTVKQLTQEFGENSWKQLPNAVMKHYRFIPAKVEVDEHHIGVYSGKKTTVW